MDEGACGDCFRMGTPASQPPTLLVDGVGNEAGGGEGSLVQGMEELSTDDFLVRGEASSPSEERFEKIIGFIEEIVVGEEFQTLQNHFLSTYWTKFRETEGDETGAEDERHEHFKIFKAYSQEMAHLLETQLRRTMRDEGFDFNGFVAEFGERVEKEGAESDLLQSEIFEMLFTLTDFVKFKELFMDFKAMMEGKTPNLSTGITHKPLPHSPRL